MKPGFDQLTVVIEDDRPERLEQLRQSLAESFEQLPQIHCLNDLTEAMSLLPSSGTLAVVCNHLMPGEGVIPQWCDLIDAQNSPLILLSSPKTSVWRAARDQPERDEAKDEAAGTLTRTKELIDAIYARVRRHHLEHSVQNLTKKLKKANRDLAEKNVDLTEAASAAHRFVDNVAHEFRTPLTVIQEFTSILNDGIGGKLSEEQRRFLRYISSATRDLTQMVEDFLDSSRLKARTLRVDRQPNSVHEMFDSVLPTVRVCGEPKNVTIETRIEDGLNEAFCDREKVGRILINLAVNAIKFSSESQTVMLWADAGNGSEVRVGVTDHGPGLTPEDLEMIGERFKQFGDPQASSTKGFGLGLNIAKELVVLNLGQMEIQSRRGEGCTFSFTMPCCDPQHILKRYQRVMRDHFGPTPLCLLRVTSRDRAPIEPLRKALSSICHPMDLVLPTMDRRGVLLLGASEQPDKWIERLMHDYERQLDPMKLSSAERASSPEKRLGPIDVVCVKSWPRARWRRTMTGQVHQMLLGLPLAA